MRDTHQNLNNTILARCCSALVLAGVLSLLVNLLALGMTACATQLYDHAPGSRSIEALAYLTLIVLGLFAVVGGMEVLRQRALLRLGLWMERQVAARTLGCGVDALRDAAQLRDAFTSSAVLALFDTPFYVLASYLLHPVLGHIVLGGTVLLVGLALATELATGTASAEAARLSMQVQRAADRPRRDPATSDGSGLPSPVQASYAALADRAATLHLTAGTRAAALHAASRAIRMALQMLALAAAAWLVADNEVTVGVMSAASFVPARALSPVEQAIGAWKQTQQVRTALRRLRTILSAAPLCA